MGIRYLVELMPVSAQAAYRRHFPNGESPPVPAVSPSKRIFLQRGIVPLDSIFEFHDLSRYCRIMTKEEWSLFRVIAGMGYFFDEERIEWFRDVLLQRHLRRVAEFLQEGFLFPFGRPVVASLLRSVFPNLEENLFSTECFNAILAGLVLQARPIRMEPD